GYGGVIEQRRGNRGALRRATRELLATAAFTRAAAYDRAITAYCASRTEEQTLPAWLDLRFERRLPLRYGENPHQQAAFYVEPSCRYACVGTAEPLHGKELSYNNLLDLDSALNLVR